MVGWWESQPFILTDDIVGSIGTLSVAKNVLFKTTVSASDKISYMSKFTLVMAWNYGGKPQTSQ